MSLTEELLRVLWECVQAAGALRALLEGLQPLEVLPRMSQLSSFRDAAARCVAQLNARTLSAHQQHLHAALTHPRANAALEPARLLRALTAASRAQQQTEYAANRIAPFLLSDVNVPAALGKPRAPRTPPRNCTGALLRRSGIRVCPSIHP